jgi:hypothetical protein
MRRENKQQLPSYTANDWLPTTRPLPSLGSSKMDIHPNPFHSDQLWCLTRQPGARQRIPIYWEEDDRFDLVILHAIKSQTFTTSPVSDPRHETRLNTVAEQTQFYSNPHHN